jgi:hypothetical protein
MQGSLFKPTTSDSQYVLGEPWSEERFILLDDPSRILVSCFTRFFLVTLPSSVRIGLMKSFWSLNHNDDAWAFA